jgi:hypothetical protein
VLLHTNTLKIFPRELCLLCCWTAIEFGWRHEDVIFWGEGSVQHYMRSFYIDSIFLSEMKLSCC